MANNTKVAVEVSAKVMAELLELAKLREMANEMKKREDAIRKNILEIAGNADEVLFEGMVIANIQHSVRRSNDLKVLEAEYPEAYEGTLRATPTTKIVVL
jgi:hypothetical protein